ncbi:MAG: hypothetical protein KQH53_14410 [Desulfarculaceae bacterium]|nr:hypothetical protein [Desulfarculaceae bacterium]
MKSLVIALLCLAALLTASSAQAYAIYNHTSHHFCLKRWYQISCYVSVDPHSTHNGEHGAGLNNVYAFYETKSNEYHSGKFSIPKGGYARIYNKRVKIYTHSDKHIKTVDITPDYSKTESREQKP